MRYSEIRKVFGPVAFLRRAADMPGGSYSSKPSGQRQAEIDVRGDGAVSA